jgi:hypothetical protein
MNIENDPGRRQTVPAYFPKACLDIPEIVHQVGQDDGIERSGYRAEVMGFGMNEFEPGMPFPGAGYHPLREIYSDPPGRDQRREQVPFGAPYFEYPFPFRDDFTEQLDNPSMIIRTEALRRKAPREGVPVGRSLPVVLCHGSGTCGHNRMPFSRILRIMCQSL